MEDTSGWHKGKHPVTGPRLVLEIQYSNSLYGGLFSRDSVFGGGTYRPLLELNGKYPQLFCKFAFRP